MIKLPASNSLRLLLIIFGLSIIVMLVGAWWYKQSITGNEFSFGSPSSQEFTAVQDQPLQEVTLKLTPTENTGTYRVSLEGLTAPLNGVAFQITDPQGGAELTSSTFTTDTSLQQGGWSSAVNSTETSETGKTLTFAIVQATPAEELTESPASVELGTLSFANVTSGLENEVSLNSSDSFATYASGEAAHLTLVIESAQDSE